MEHGVFSMLRQFVLDTGTTLGTVLFFAPVWGRLAIAHIRTGRWRNDDPSVVHAMWSRRALPWTILCFIAGAVLYVVGRLVRGGQI